MNLLIGALLPVALILWYVYRRDRLPEPPKVVARTFLLGVAIALPVVLVEWWLDSAGEAAGIQKLTILHAGFTSFVVAATVEEVFKFLVLWFYAAKHDAFDEPMDGIVYGVAVSLGFAAIENVGYVYGSEYSEGNGSIVALMRAFTAVPGHAADGVLLGACIGIAKFAGPRRRLWVAAGLGGTIAVHGMYDFGLFAAQGMAADGNDAAGVLFVLVTLGTLFASVVASGLALARMRRDQRLALEARRIPEVAAPMEPAPALDDLTDSRNERLLSERPTPSLPMAALVTAAVGVAMWLVMLAIVIVAAAGDLQSSSEELGPLEIVAVLLFLSGAIVGGVAACLGVYALVKDPRWKPASILSIVVGAMMLFGFVLFMLLGMALS